MQESCQVSQNFQLFFCIGYRALKSGRSVKAVRIFWGIKDQIGRVEAAKELERSKVGRKARREGAVEYIADAERVERGQIAQALSKIGQSGSVIYKGS